MCPKKSQRWAIPWSHRKNGLWGPSQDTASLLALKPRAGSLALTKHNTTGTVKGVTVPHSHKGGKDLPVGQGWAPPGSVGEQTSQQVMTMGGHLEGTSFHPALTFPHSRRGKNVRRQEERVGLLRGVSSIWRVQTFKSQIILRGCSSFWMNTTGLGI